MLLNKVVYNHINFACRDMKAKKMGRNFRNLRCAMFIMLKLWPLRSAVSVVDGGCVVVEVNGNF